MPSWYLWLAVGSLVYTGTSIILFRNITVRRINRLIKESGEYYLSTDDKVGYTLLSVALAVVLPLKYAQVIVPKIVVDADSVKRLKLSKKDIFLSFSYIFSLISFLIVGLFGTKFD